MHQISLIMKTALFIIALLFAVTLNAATASIEKVWLEHGLMVGNRSAMKVHCKFKIDNALNQNCSMGVWVMDASGKWLKLNSGYTANDGTKFFRQSFTPIYKSSTFHDLELQCLTDDLNLHTGTNTYSVIVTISDNNGNILAQSEPVSFTGTLQSNGTPATPGYSNGSYYSTPSGFCQRCGGTGVDAFYIEGKYEYMYSADKIGYVNWTNARCPYCTKTDHHIHAKCAYCKGTGR